MDHLKLIYGEEKQMLRNVDCQLCNVKDLQNNFHQNILFTYEKLEIFMKC